MNHFHYDIQIITMALVELVRQLTSFVEKHKRLSESEKEDYGDALQSILDRLNGCIKGISLQLKDVIKQYPDTADTFGYFMEQEGKFWDTH